MRKDFLENIPAPTYSWFTPFPTPVMKYLNHAKKSATIPFTVHDWWPDTLVHIKTIRIKPDESYFLYPFEIYQSQPYLLFHVYIGAYKPTFLGICFGQWLEGEKRCSAKRTIEVPTSHIGWLFIWARVQWLIGEGNGWENSIAIKEGERGQSLSGEDQAASRAEHVLPPLTLHQARSARSR